MQRYNEALKVKRETTPTLHHQDDITSNYSSSVADRTAAALTVNCDKPELKTFNYTEYKCQDMEHDVDLNFYNDIIDNCCYYSEDKFSGTVQVDNELPIKQQQELICKY